MQTTIRHHQNASCDRVWQVPQPDQVLLIISLLAVSNRRAKQFVRRISKSQRYGATAAGLKAMTALITLREKVIKPLLAAAQAQRKPRKPRNPTLWTSIMNAFGSQCGASSKS